MDVLQIQNISHVYFSQKTTTTALLDVSLSAKKGEFISIIGPSGCGKTTLLSIMAGLISPTKGDVFIDGEPVQFGNRKTGYMLQQDYLFPWKTIEENALLGLKLSNKLNEENKMKTIVLLNKMGLTNVEKMYPKQLSGGMRQRVSLVRTLATDPKLLLLDEPFSALDFQTKLKLEELVFNTLKQFQKTAVLVTHDIGEAIAMSDRIYLLSNGPGTIHEIFDVPEKIRNRSPLEARSQPEYNVLFQRIWKELESLANKDEY
ncbi:ABC transporter ATP-binding protein [Fervidibacillus halotolerans]|uniref:ABC transporter ATP-binding protein n=1 Tax=Fervidibacillus halotolerans TaxID=2980027 RepID=A0A9E8LXX3_9BACI|nr:ABC transporter ATP-binding protein [Fervidibacillus halotolerans]WAA11788.1 ABC transporter ATP-binding protein [Fervidibacillus halotolerans]